MSVKLDEEEPLGSGLKRVLLGEIVGARRVLETTTDANRSEAVHNARRALKRARSVLKVFEPVIGKDYDRRHAALGTIADCLAGARDADVVLARARWLGRHIEPEGAEAISKLIAELELKATTAHQEATDFAAVIASLRASEADAASLSPDIDGARLLTEAFETLYRRGRNDWKACRDGADEETFHAWRRRVKHRWHLTQLVLDQTPATSKAICRDLERLGDILGEERDLGLLHALLDEEPALAGGKRALHLIDHVVARRRNKLKRRAVELGEELYGLKTRRVLQKFHATAALEA